MYSVMGKGSKSRGSWSELAYGPFCQISMKVSHLTRSSAKLALSRMAAPPGLYVYKCDCGFYHVGTKRVNGEVCSRQEHRDYHRRRLGDEEVEE